MAMAQSRERRAVGIGEEWWNGVETSTEACVGACVYLVYSNILPPMFVRRRTQSGQTGAYQRRDGCLGGELG